MSDERTRTLYNVWKDSRHLLKDKVGDDLMMIKYYDGAVIMPTQFSVHVGNQEFHTDSLEKAEQWLWNNWVRHEKEAGEV